MANGRIKNLQLSKNGGKSNGKYVYRKIVSLYKLKRDDTWHWQLLCVIFRRQTNQQPDLRPQIDRKCYWPNMMRYWSSWFRLTMFLIFSVYNWSQLKGVEPFFAFLSWNLSKKNRSCMNEKQRKRRVFAVHTMPYPFIAVPNHQFHLRQGPLTCESFDEFPLTKFDKAALNAGFDLHLPFAFPSFPDVVLSTRLRTAPAYWRYTIAPAGWNLWWVLQLLFVLYYTLLYYIILHCISLS